MRPGARPHRRHRRGGGVRGPAAADPGPDGGRRQGRRPQDRPDLCRRPGAARGGPARLRRAVRGHAGGRGRARSDGPAPAAQGRGRDRLRARCRPRRRGEPRHGASGSRPCHGRAGDRRQPHRRLGHLLLRHRCGQRVQWALRARRPAADARRLRAPRHRRDPVRRRAGRAPRAPALHVSATRYTPSPGSPRRPATSATRSGQVSWCCRAPSAPWRRSGPGLRSGPNCPAATAARSAPSPQTSQESKHETHQGRRDRLRQHRHRPDDQGLAPVRHSRDGRNGRHRPGLRRACPCAPSRGADDARGGARVDRDAGLRRDRRSSSTPPPPGLTARMRPRSRRTASGWST